MAKNKKLMQTQHSLIVKELGTTIEQYNREYDEIMKRMDSGHYVTHENALKRLSKWKRKEDRLER